MMHVTAFAVMFALASACAAHPTSPQQGAQPGGHVRLTAEADRTQIAPGTTAVVTFRLENLTSAPLTLDFGSTCQVMPYVERRPAGGLVHPSGGGWGCATMLTELTLAPNGVASTALRVTAGTSSGEVVGLAPGEYAVFARLHDRVHQLESNRVTLSVQ